MPVDRRPVKGPTRRAVRAARAARTHVDGAAAVVEDALVRHVPAVLGHVPAGGSVAAYVSLPGEPGTGLLRQALRHRGHPVLLPVLLPDHDLGWVTDDGAAEGTGADDDPLHPAGTRLAPDAVAGCAAVLLPALAVDANGTRLGQGGGSYDRALAHLVQAPARPLLLAVVHDDEVLPGGALPREPHDVPVDGWLCPSGLRLVRAGTAGS